MRYAVLLAAGRGERLWPLTSTRPKPLVPLPGGETLLTRLMRQLRGLVDGYLVVVSPGPLGRMVAERIAEEGYVAETVVQEEPLGTGHAALVGLRALPRGVDEALIVNGDMFTERGLFEALVAAGAPAVAGVRHPEPWNYGVLAPEGSCLRRVEEKPPNPPPGAVVNAGAYLVPRRVFEELLAETRPSPRGEVEITDALRELAARTCVKLVQGNWFWLDVGRPWDLFTAYSQVLREKLGNRGEPLIEPGAEVEPGAAVRGPVYLPQGAVVRTGSIVEGPAWIEGEAGPLARLRPGTFLHRGAKAGAHTEIKNSILLSGAKAPHLNYVGDSILGENVNLGAGTVTANLRFDHATVKMRLKGRIVDTGLRKLGAIMGDHSQTGVNVSTLPGTRIGAYSWVYPGLVIGHDVPDCVLAKPAQGGVEFRSLRGRIDCPPWLPASTSSNKK